MNAPASIKRLGIEGVSKKDMFSVDPRLLKIEDGFNLRDLDPEHVAGFEATIRAGGTIPPIDIRGTRDKELFIVDGHHRHAAVMNLISSGEDIKSVNCCSYAGSDSDRVCLMLTSANGKPLTPMEQAIGFLRLSRYGWTKEQIAARVARTTIRVEQLLDLAVADSAIHAMIRAGTVSADMALEMIRKHGDGAADALAAAIAKASSSGKKKVTRAGINGRALPKKIVKAAIHGIEVAATLVGDEARHQASLARLMSAEDLADETATIPMAALIELLDAAEAVAGVNKEWGK